MRRLNLDQLATLIAVVELGSFSAAARRLNLTQPAVSAQIRELEERVGVRLLDRAGKSVRATAAGRELTGHAERMMAEADRALAAMRGHRAGHAGRVHLGTGPTALAYLLPPVLQNLRENYPDIELVITTGATHGIAERMLNNFIDLGLVALPVDEGQFDVVRICEDEMVAIFATTERNIPDTVTPADAAARPLILEYQRANQNRHSRAWIKAAGHPVKPVMQLDGIEPIKDAVASGLGMAIVPKPALDGGAARKSLVSRPLDPPLTRTLALIQRRDKPDDPAVLIVREAILALAERRDPQPSPEKPAR